jgi:PHP family Zn ribbon phosphoesterase
MSKCEGTVFRKADLHVHTPKSVCYRDKSVMPEQIVDTALANGLEVIAITDHNTAAAIDDVVRAAKDKDLFVFPGIELSTREGHVFAIFDLATPLSILEDFLDDVGIDGERQGDATAVADVGMEQVCQKTAEHNGVTIAAHIERWPSGFLETNQSRRVKMRIHGNQHLSALEITVPQNRGLWNEGKNRGFPKKYACIQSSDAHALEEIGRRPVYIHMEEVGLAAIRSAFLDHGTKIVFPNECPSSPNG